MGLKIKTIARSKWKSCYKVFPLPYVDGLRIEYDFDLGSSRDDYQLALAELDALDKEMEHKGYYKPMEGDELEEPDDDDDDSYKISGYGVYEK